MRDYNNFNRYIKKSNNNLKQKEVEKLNNILKNNIRNRIVTASLLAKHDNRIIIKSKDYKLSTDFIINNIVSGKKDENADENTNGNDENDFSFTKLFENQEISSRNLDTIIPKSRVKYITKNYIPKGFKISTNFINELTKDINDKLQKYSK